MTISIGCRELGIDCYFVTDGETMEGAIESLMRHVQMEHDEDWFEIEDIYESACQVIRKRAS